MDPSSMRDLFRRVGYQATDHIRLDVLRSWSTQTEFAEIAASSQRLPTSDWLVAMHTLESSRPTSYWEWVHGQVEDNPYLGRKLVPRVVGSVHRAVTLLEDHSFSVEFVRAMLSGPALLPLAVSAKSTRPSPLLLPRVLAAMFASLSSDIARGRLLSAAPAHQVSATPGLSSYASKVDPYSLLKSGPVSPPEVLPTRDLLAAIRSVTSPSDSKAPSTEHEQVIPMPDLGGLDHDLVLKVLEFRPDVAGVLAGDDCWLPLLVRTSHWNADLARRGLRMLKSALNENMFTAGAHLAAFAASMILHHGTPADIRGELAALLPGMAGNNLTLEPGMLQKLDDASRDPWSYASLETVKGLLEDPPVDTSIVGWRILYLNWFIGRRTLRAPRRVPRSARLVGKVLDWHAYSMRVSLRPERGIWRLPNLGMHLTASWQRLSQTPGLHVEGRDVLAHLEHTLESVPMSDAAFTWQVLLDLDTPVDVRVEDALDVSVETALAIAGLPAA